MSHPIDVGSVLGGRYKVTATVLTSHDEDLVLDGTDQVLNRPVSILVAGPHNADQVAQSAREVATGERPGSVQILDLGVSDATTYLITNHTSAADLLDLVVASNPPYVEPFFTDTLGSEIFGQARSHEPELYDDEEEVDAGYITYGDAHRSQGDAYLAARPGRSSGHSAEQQAGAAAPSAPARKAPIVPPLPPGRPGVPAAGAGTPAGTAAAAGAAGAAAASQGRPRTDVPETTAPQPVQRENVEQALLHRERNRSADTTDGSHESDAVAAGGRDEQPKVSLWSQDDYVEVPDEQYTEGHYTDDHYTDGVDSRHGDRHASSFPAAAGTGLASAGSNYDDDDDEPRQEPRSMRWLVGGLLAAVLVVGLIFAVTNLGSLIKPAPQSQETPGSVATTPGEAATGSPSPSQSTAAAAGPPAVEGVTRLGTFDFASTYDGDLTKTFDGNSASYWSDMEFATDNWGGLAPDGVPLVVKLKDPSKISSITLNQLGASGGNISVFTNDRPSLDGAKQVGTNSFTSPDLTMPLAEPVTAEYVIVSIKNLPRLAAPKTRYGFGLRLAEIKVQ
ncbi:ABC transporter substrate-binding protein [Arthrobacter pascens]|uniref:ABC transporter substrate-binding protein n=1 Tax=Arthrobacter pascens TaxID=1677 RepID=UPI00196AF06D|nr:ABC transporter substrate-binding protein [Arthrobacter pascens]MBN3499497.1 ABC transporter substrate-binding protein [Arthrobacter pascens]